MIFENQESYDTEYFLFLMLHCITRSCRSILNKFRKMGEKGQYYYPPMSDTQTEMENTENVHCMFSPRETSARPGRRHREKVLKNLLVSIRFAKSPSLVSVLVMRSVRPVRLVRPVRQQFAETPALCAMTLSSVTAIFFFLLIYMT